MGEQITYEQRILFRLEFLHAQVSGVFSAIKHLLRGTEEWGASAKANLAFVKSEIGDLIVQTHLLCDQLGLSYGECEELGTQRYEESKAAWEARGWGEKWA